MRKPARYLALAGLLTYFGACSGENRQFGDGPMGAAGQAMGTGSGTGGSNMANTGGSGGANASGGAAGTDMLMVVKVPCTASRQCDDGNPCNGVEICAGGFCAAEGVNKADGTACPAPPGSDVIMSMGAAGAAGADMGPSITSPSNNFFCTNGSCTRGYCGDGYGDAAAGEQCDDANLDDTDGCRANCTFTCVGSEECDDGNFCNGTEVCAGNKCITGAKPADKAICNAEMTKECRQETCVVIGCGDGVLDEGKGEECDDGNVTANDGCEIDCKWTCKADEDCSDNNLCSGIETCDKTDPLKPFCKAGMPVACDDGNACTDNLCNPADGQCLYPLIDKDIDGEASSTLGACGTDCNDDDAAIFSKNQEVCKDGKDNDCNPATPDDTSDTKHYLDCDGDGYANSTAFITECNPPPPKQGLCPPGSANTWTTRAPDPKSLTDWDCNDNDHRARPGQTQYFPEPHYPPGSNFGSYDFNCDNKETPYYTGVNVSTTATCSGSSCAAGYSAVSYPACGKAAEYSQCEVPNPKVIIKDPILLPAQLVYLPPIYYFCNSNATYRSAFARTQTCL